MTFDAEGAEKFLNVIYFLASKLILLSPSRKAWQISHEDILTPFYSAGFEVYV